MTKQASLQAQGPSGAGADGSLYATAASVTTLKTNVIGLGNYINSINREVNSLATRTKESVENINKQMAQLTTEVGSIKNTKKSSLDLGSDSFLPSSVKTDVASLSTQLFTLKTSVFEMSGDLTGVKNGLQSIKSDVQSVKSDIKDVSGKIISGEQVSKTTRNELSTIRNGLSGITNTLFTVRTKVKAFEDVEEEVADLAKNLTGMSSRVTLTRQEVAKLRPEVDFLVTDITSVRDGMSRMTRAMQIISDPPRFSCGVTGEELKVSGVITYDECTVNFDSMMNQVSGSSAVRDHLGVQDTGHATVPAAGDYMLSFTANMVSSNSQAIWCALYKQSPGDEGWQVLGMINNYQRDAGDEDDRDSGSLSLLASLAEGDQVRSPRLGATTLLAAGVGGVAGLRGVVPLQQSLQADLLHWLPRHQSYGLTRVTLPCLPSSRDRNTKQKSTSSSLPALCPSAFFAPP